MVHAVSKVRFLEHGKNAPKNSRFKGVMSAASIIGWLDYTRRDDATEVNKNIGARKDGYFGYTSTREGATKTFSSLGWLETENTKVFRNMIRQSFSKDGNLFWDEVISLKDYESASRSNLLDADDYAAVVSKVLPVYFKKIGLDPENMIWWMNYHTNKENPHMHISFLEKEQTRTKGKFTGKQLDSLKGQFIKEMGLREIFKNEIQIDSNQYFKMKDHDKTEIIRAIRDLDFDSKNLNLDSFIKKLPKTGRLQYNSVHIAPFKNELNAIIEQVLNEPEIKPKMDEWLKKVETLARMTNQAAGGEISKIKDTEVKKLYTNIGNEILKNAKPTPKPLVDAIIDEDGVETKHTITINKKLIIEETNDHVITRIPFTKQTFQLEKDEYKWLSSNTVKAVISNKIKYKVHENPHLFEDIEKEDISNIQGKLIHVLNGSELSKSYDEVLKKNNAFKQRKQNITITKSEPEEESPATDKITKNQNCRIVEMSAGKSLFVGETPNNYIVRIPKSVHDVFAIPKRYVKWNAKNTSARLFLNSDDEMAIYYDKNVFDKVEPKQYSTDDKFDGVLIKRIEAIDFFDNFDNPAIYDAAHKLDLETMEFMLQGDYDIFKRMKNGNIINKSHRLNMRDVGKCAMQYIAKHDQELERDINIFLNSSKEKG